MLNVITDHRAIALWAKNVPVGLSPAQSAAASSLGRLSEDVGALKDTLVDGGTRAEMCLMDVIAGLKEEVLALKEEI